MKDRNNKKSYREELENGFPVPEKLLPENIEKTINDKLYKRNRRIKVLTSITAVAACAAVVVTAGLSMNAYNRNTYRQSLTVSEEKAVMKYYDKSSYDEIYELLSEKSEAVELYERLETNDMEIIEDFLTEESGGLIPKPGNSNTDIGSSKDDHYKTYLQTEGVDEADIIKTDGKFIYYIANGKLYCVVPNDGKPYASDSVYLTADDYYTSPEIYLTENSLIAIYSGSEKTYAAAFRVTSAGKLEKVTEYSQNGNYNDSRLIGDKLYLVSSEYKNFNIMEKDKVSTYIPYYEINGEDHLVEPKDIYVSKNDCYGLCYTTIGGIDLGSSKPLVSIKTTIGGEAQVYCSAENLYIMRNVPDLKSWNLTETEILKAHLSDGNISFTAAAQVEGYIKDQFSADEKDGFLRIVTTRVSDNALYVLDSKLNKLSEIGGMGKNETVKSVSFSGDKAYIVTFRQTDPLYTVDLSDPKNPVITDELKVSGFSTHLRKYGENLLFGFGYEADENTGRTNGLKLSMFRLEENGSSTEIARQLIHSYGVDTNVYVYSAAAFDHKELMIVPEKNIIGFGYTLSGCYDENDELIVEDYDYFYNDYTDNYDYYDYREKFFYEIYSYTDNGFELLSSVEFASGAINSRGIYIGDTAYIFCGNEIAAVDLKTGETISMQTL